MGLSLLRIERWEKRRLHVSGLDLVNGTPVYDIKPFVPWDAPTAIDNNMQSPRFPDWVQTDDTIGAVDFSTAALHQLRAAVADGCLGPLYLNENDGFEGAHQALSQILAQDPRSSHRGLVSNARGQRSEGQVYNIVFCNIQVSFSVAETSVHVVSVQKVEFEPDSYADGIPLIFGKSVVRPNPES